MTMKMPYLPSDLVEEILSRVPAIPLKRLQSTCKRWNVLFKDQRFTEKHLRKASKESLALMLKESRVCSMYVNLNVAPPSLQFKGPLEIKDSHCSSSQQADIDNVFHCDGLLLCTTKDDRLVVWNPCLGETRWIQPKTSYDYINSKFALGYENNKSCHRYKILRCTKGENMVTRIEIYEFSFGSWRSLIDEDKDEFEFGYILLRKDGVSLKGKTYWYDYDFLLRFNFTSERFESLRLPQSERRGTTCLSVVKDEHLSLLYHSGDGSNMEIWVSSRIGGDVALFWTKSFTFDLRIRNIHLDLVSFLIYEEKKVVVCCHDWLGKDMKKVYVFGDEDKSHTDFSFVDSRFPFIFDYVPSLVQIQ